jgi:hypothetical protein
VDRVQFYPFVELKRLQVLKEDMEIKAGLLRNYQGIYSAH